MGIVATRADGVGVVALDGEARAEPLADAHGWPWTFPHGTHILIGTNANMSDDRYDRAVSRHWRDRRRRWTTTISPP